MASIDHACFAPFRPRVAHSLDEVAVIVYPERADDSASVRARALDVG
jgi:hypothetical protein